jgi:adenylate cyclase
MELHRDELPNLFAALVQGQAFDAVRADRDRRATELFDTYLAPLGIAAAYVAPVVSGERLLGMLLVEEPQRGDQGTGLAEFSAALASLFALRYASAPATDAVADRPRPASREPARQPAADPVAARATSLQGALTQRNMTPGQFGAGRVDQAAVAVIKLPDWLSAAQRPAGGGTRPVMDAMVGEIRQTIEHSGAAYAGMLDDQIVIAALPAHGASPDEQARLAALTAIEVRDRLLRLEETLGVDLGFRLALDVGPVMVSGAGAESPVRNVWGGAVGVARALASSAGQRTIAASETTYAMLSGDFLFRPCGRYFLPETGTMRTFILVGEL